MFGYTFVFIDILLANMLNPDFVTLIELRRINVLYVPPKFRLNISNYFQLN